MNMRLYRNTYPIICCHCRRTSQKFLKSAFMIFLFFSFLQTIIGLISLISTSFISQSEQETTKGTS